MAHGVVRTISIVVGITFSFAFGELLHWLGLTSLIWELEGHPHDSIAPAIWIFGIWPFLAILFGVGIHKALIKRYRKTPESRV